MINLIDIVILCGSLYLLLAWGVWRFFKDLCRGAIIWAFYNLTAQGKHHE